MNNLICWLASTYTDICNLKHSTGLRFSSSNRQQQQPWAVVAALPLLCFSRGQQQRSFSPPHCEQFLSNSSSGCPPSCSSTRVFCSSRSRQQQTPVASLLFKASNVSSSSLSTVAKQRPLPILLFSQQLRFSCSNREIPVAGSTVNRSRRINRKYRPWAGVLSFSSPATSAVIHHQQPPHTSNFPFIPWAAAFNPFPTISITQTQVSFSSSLHVKELCPANVSFLLS